MGEQLPQMDVRTTTGAEVPLARTKYAIVVDSPSASFPYRSFARRAAMLAALQPSPELSFTLIAGSGAKLLASDVLGSRAVSAVPDPNSRIARALRVPPGSTRLLVLSQGQVLFSALGFMDPEDLREIYSLYATGRIDYNPDLGELADRMIGSPLPNPAAVNVESGQETSLWLALQNHRKVWIFTPACTTCSVRTFLQALAEIPPAQRPLPLFSSSFGEDLLKAAISNVNYHGVVLLARQQLAGFENLQYDTSRDDAASFIVQIAQGNNAILAVQPVSALDAQRVAANASR